MGNKSGHRRLDGAGDFVGESNIIDCRNKIVYYQVT
jgi:hypothetical protein